MKGIQNERTEHRDNCLPVWLLRKFTVTGPSEDFRSLGLRRRASGKVWRKKEGRGRKKEEEAESLPVKAAVRVSSCLLLPAVPPGRACIFSHPNGGHFQRVNLEWESFC